MTTPSSPIRLVIPHVPTHLPAHEHAARARRRQAGLAGYRKPRQPRPAVVSGRKTEATQGLAQPPVGWGLNPSQV